MLDMNKNFLIVGKWYRIKCKTGSELTSFGGRALYVGNAPIQYQANVMKFLCEDGQVAYFTGKDVSHPIPTPDQLNLNKTLLKSAELIR